MIDVLWYLSTYMCFIQAGWPFCCPTISVKDWREIEALMLTSKNCRLDLVSLDPPSCLWLAISPVPASCVVLPYWLLCNIQAIFPKKVTQCRSAMFCGTGHRVQSLVATWQWSNSLYLTAHELMGENCQIRLHFHRWALILQFLYILWSW